MVFANAVEKFTGAFRGLPVNDVFAILPVLERKTFDANDEVVANDAEAGMNVIDVAADAVIATLLLPAQLEVPNNEPVYTPINDPVNDPVFICKELDIVPTGKNAVT